MRSPRGGGGAPHAVCSLQPAACSLRPAARGLPPTKPKLRPHGGRATPLLDVALPSRPAAWPRRPGRGPVPDRRPIAATILGRCALRVALGVDVSASDVDRLIGQIDNDGNGVLNFDEFMGICQDRS